MARTKQTARNSTGEAAPRMNLKRKASDDPPSAELGAGNESVLAPVYAPQGAGIVYVDETQDAHANVVRIFGAVPRAQLPPAHRKALTPKTNKKKKKNGREQDSPGPVELTRLMTIEEKHDPFCYLCQNGGDCIECDKCERSLCLSHVKKIQAVPVDVMGMLEFLCPACHMEDDIQHRRSTPYIGLYNKLTGGPFFQDGKHLDVEGEIARPQQARCMAQPLVIINVRLASLSEGGCPARCLYHSVQDYYPAAHAEKLLYIDAPYNFDYTEDAAEYRTRLANALKLVDRFPRAQIVFFIYTHSEEGSGDLFYAKGIASENLDSWWDDVIPKEFNELGQRHNITMGLLTCGALIQDGNRRAILLRRAQELNAEKVFAFSAANLQVSLLVHFFCAYTNKVFIEGVRPDEAHLGAMLSHAMFMGRHTDIIVFSRDAEDSNTLRDTGYVWAHQHIAPFGEKVPIQCPNCGKFRTIKCRINGDGKEITATCGANRLVDASGTPILEQLVDGKITKQVRCTYKRVYSLPPASKFIKNGEGGQWLHLRPAEAQSA